MNFEIYRKLRENKITIPFPQRDLNIGDGELKVRIVDDSRDEENAAKGEEVATPQGLEP